MGEGGLATLTLCPDSDAPFLKPSQADKDPDQFASATNKIPIFELPAAVATVCAHRDKLKNKKLYALY